MGCFFAACLFVQTFIFSKETFMFQVWNSRLAVTWIAIACVIFFAHVIGTKYKSIALISTFLSLVILLSGMHKIIGSIGFALLFSSPRSFDLDEAIAPGFAILFAIKLIKNTIEINTNQ